MNVAPSRIRAATSLVALGFTTAVAQALLLREAMAALGGSELAWGAVLALWLAAMGAGAGLGARGRSSAAAALAPAAVAALAAAGVVLLRATPALVGASPGEAVATWRAGGVWVAAVLPAALAGGWTFPALARGLATDAAGTAYALESAGAMAGGLAFTFALAPLGSAAAAAIALGVALGAGLALLGRPWLALACAVGAAAASGPAGEALARAGWRWAGRPGALAAWTETRQQRIEIGTGDAASVYSDGQLVGTFPDPYHTAARAHLALLLHPSPRRVLVLGALARGGLAAMLQHPVAALTVAEEDPELPDAVRPWVGSAERAALADPRVRLRAGEPLRLLRSGGPWDVIVLADPDPATLRRSRTRTVEFFRACRDALDPRGALVVPVGVADTYLGGDGGRLLATVDATLRAVFPAVAAVPGDEVLLVASPGAVPPAIDPAVLAARLAERGIADPDFPAEAIRLLVDPERAASLRTFLAAAIATPNRVGRPAAVPLAAALHEARGAPPVLRVVRAIRAGGTAPLVGALTVAVALLLARGAARAQLGVELAAVVGFVAMGWWLILLWAWQATRGAAYAEMGALSAIYMAGTVVGAAWARRRARRSTGYLAAVLAGGAGLSLLVASGAPWSWTGAVLPLLAAAGALAGAAFPAVAARAGAGDAPRGTGRGFAADEAGAAVAALVFGVVVLPAAGMSGAALGLAALAGAGAAAVGISARRA